MSDAERSLTPAQARAARALLGWSQKDFAARAGVAEPTVTQFERGARNPSRAVAWAMRAAFEAGGVEFIDAIPRNPSGKLLRKVLRDRLRAQQAAKAKL